jgi:Dr1-associated corepressor
MKKRGHPLSARIKRLMQADEDVGKISQATPVLIGRPQLSSTELVYNILNYHETRWLAGRALELFLQKMCTKACAIAQSRQAKALTPAHM